MPDNIRISIGTASLLGLVQCKLDALPTTAYTMTYVKTRCSANCAFCAQARESEAKANQLSRVTWPSYPLDEVTVTLAETGTASPFRRLCIQTVCYPSLITDLASLISEFKKIVPYIPISLALPPLNANQLQALYDYGVDRVAISLDAVTPELFDSIKGSNVHGPFTWNQHWRTLNIAQSIFGSHRTTTHLIIGLGETEQQTVYLIQELVNNGITIGLFPFTPIVGTPLENHHRPSLGNYRRIQLAHYLLQNHVITAADIRFNASRQITRFGLTREQLADVIARGKAFQTSGCPSCNRPFFTETPRGPLYNYPFPPSDEALQEIKFQLTGVL